MRKIAFPEALAISKHHFQLTYLFHVNNAIYFYHAVYNLF
jgi:hypothetical protein